MVVNNLAMIAINFDFLTCDDGTDCDWVSVSKTFLSVLRVEIVKYSNSNKQFENLLTSLAINSPLTALPDLHLHRHQCHQEINNSHTEIIAALKSGHFTFNKMLLPSREVEAQ